VFVSAMIPQHRHRQPQQQKRTQGKRTQSPFYPILFFLNRLFFFVITLF
jgi:hypothetical protein